MKHFFDLKERQDSNLFENYARVPYSPRPHCVPSCENPIPPLSFFESGLPDFSTIVQNYPLNGIQCGDVLSKGSLGLKEVVHSLLVPGHH